MLLDRTPEPRQLLLEFPVRAACGRDDFLVGASNRDAAALIDRWPDWPAVPQLIVGPPGSGKTHLVEIWASAAGAVVARDRFLAGEVLGAIEDGKPVAIELGAGGEIDQVATFHLLNAARQHRTPMLATARRNPADWSEGLPDLISRLRAMTPTFLGAPDDTLLRQVMVKLFADRQTVVQMSVLDFALLRLERSFEAANMFVSWCDDIALRSGRRVSKAVAAEALAAVEAELHAARGRQRPTRTGS